MHFPRSETAIQAKHERAPTYYDTHMDKYYSRETAPKPLGVPKPLKILSDFPWFRDSGNPPGNFPEPDLIAWDEAASRQDAKDMYCELHEVFAYEEEVPDYEFFVHPASFEPLPNVPDFSAGRDPKLPTSEKNKP